MLFNKVQSIEITEEKNKGDFWEVFINIKIIIVINVPITIIISYNMINSKKYTYTLVATNR